MYLDEITPENTEKAVRLLKNLNEWLTRLEGDPEVRKHRYDAALNAANRAILETREYMRDIREKKNRNPEEESRNPGTEKQLSKVWKDVAEQIQPYDAGLASLCWVKASGWADEAAWNAPENKDLPISVDQMLEHVRQLAKNPQPRDLPSWFPIAGVLFTLLSVILLFYLLLAPQGIAPDKRFIFNVFAAICVAASASFLGGTAQAHGRIPGFKQTPIQFAAVGGVAVFIIVFLILNSTS